jgi:hypothetical protein
MVQATQELTKQKIGEESKVPAIDKVVDLTEVDV